MMHRLGVAALAAVTIATMPGPHGSRPVPGRDGCTPRGRGADTEHCSARKKHFAYFDYQQQRLKPTLLQALLAKQPLVNLDCEQSLQDKWHKLGLNTLGDILALPQAALAKRFGQTFLKDLQKLTGAHPDPQRSIRVADAFFTHVSRCWIWPITRSAISLV